jgi:hypothetical protein
MQRQACSFSTIAKKRMMAADARLQTKTQTRFFQKQARPNEKNTTTFKIKWKTQECFQALHQQRVWA